MTIIYKIEFFTYWHTGSGLSGGVETSLQVIKNEHGLPFIPGRTLKGLLREAAVIINDLHSDAVSQDFIASIFGIGEDKNQEEIFKQGQCFFGNATLSKSVSEHLKDEAEKRKYLFTAIASTAINENGLAKDQSLRQIEATIPLTLYAEIENFPDDDTSLAQLQKCFQWIKKMGYNRTRGFGRCEFSHYKPTLS